MAARRGCSVPALSAEWQSEAARQGFACCRSGSLDNVESPKRETPQVLVEGDEVEAPGPATPTSFREQCYLDRERLEKKPRVSASSKKRGSTGSRDVTGLVGQFSQL